jgi:MscS family membrane protein
MLNELDLMGGSVLWGVAPWRVAVALAIIFVGFASRRAIQGLFLFFGRKAKDTRVKWDDEAARLLPKPLAIVAQILLWRVAASVLVLPTEPVDIRLIVAKGLEAALMAGLVWVLFRIVDVLASVTQRFATTTSTRIDDQAVPLMRKTLKVFVAVLGGVFIIQNLGYSVLSVIAGLGVGGLALALAAQDSVANFFGSVVLFTDAPFQIGDYVEVEGVQGTVEEVGFRTTRIRQDDSSLVSIPNQTFTGSFITNYSARKGRMVEFEFGIAPIASAVAVADFLSRTRALFSSHPEIETDSVEVFLTGLGQWSIQIAARAFTEKPDWTLFLAVREELLLGLLRTLDECGLTLAHGASTVFVRDGHPDLLAFADGDGLADSRVPPTTPGEA